MLFTSILLVSTSQNGVVFPNGKPEVIPNKFRNKSAENTDAKNWKEVFPWLAISKPAFLCAYITSRDAEVFMDPKNPASIIKKANFLQGRQDRSLFPFHVGDVFGEKGNEFLLLVEAVNPNSDSDGKIKENEDGYFGWVHINNLTIFLQSKGAPTLYALEEEKTGISRKAMLINKLPEKKTDFKELIGNIQFLDKPSTEGKKTTQRGLFSIYYIVDVFPKGSRAGRESHFLLSTGSETFHTEHRNQILGWVRKDRVVEWNTRECIEPYRNFEQSGDSPYERERPGLYFKSREALLDYVKFAKEKEIRVSDPLFLAELNEFLKDKLISKEEIGGANWSWTYPMARFPILESDNLQSPYNHRIYRVGVIGDVFTADGTVAIQARKSDLLRHEIEKLKASTGKIQVKFVMDATFGMDKWFKSGATAVENIINDVQNIGGSQSKDRLGYEFSVNFYRDIREVESGPVFQDFPFLKGPGAIGLLKNAKAVGGWDDPDAVFLGIEKSLTSSKSKFDHDAIKVLIVIGDDGDQNTPGLIEGVSALIEAEGKGNPINFFAVSVGNQDIPRYRDFSSQMRELCSSLNRNERSRREKSIAARQLPPAQESIARRMLSSFKVAEMIMDQDGSRVTARISEKFQESMREMRVKMEEYRKVISGDEENTGVFVTDGDGIAGAYRMAWKDQVLNQIRERGFDPLLLARNGVQLFQEAWVLETDPLETKKTRDLEDPNKTIFSPCVRFLWFVDKPDFDGLRGYVNQVVSGKDWDPKTLQDTWIEALNRTTYGDLIKKASQDESLRSDQFGTPEKVFKQVFKGIKLQSAILKMDFNEVGILSPNDIKKQYCKLQTKLKRMDAVEKNRRFLFGEQFGEISTLGDPRQYWYEVEQGQDLKAWLDRQIFP
jgi:hypothetical protein